MKKNTKNINKRVIESLLKNSNNILKNKKIVRNLTKIYLITFRKI